MFQKLASVGLRVHGQVNGSHGLVMIAPIACTISKECDTTSIAINVTAVAVLAALVVACPLAAAPVTLRAPRCDGPHDGRHHACLSTVGLGLDALLLPMLLDPRANCLPSPYGLKHLQRSK